MQDRFKFRVFINNKMYNVFYYYKTENGVIFACTNLKEDTGFNIDGTTLMQCIGLQDKNGKLIYIGDVVKDDATNSIYKVCEKKCAIYLENNEFIGYFHELSTAFAEKRLEVIGNIYENAELLEE